VISIIFGILMVAVFGKMIIWSFRATWGILRVLLTIVLLPLILIAMALSGLIYVALVVLVICGVVTWVASALA
jgi:hypothetical protein